MKYLLFLVCFNVSLLLCAQPTEIISALRSINREVVNAPCTNGSGRLISSRAFNLFLANKIGYYLSSENDFSFYKNNVLVNTADGSVAVIHNTFEAKGLDEPVRSVMFFGVKANVSDAFVKNIVNKSAGNNLAIVIKQTWLGKSKTYLNCTGGSSALSPKNYMDAQRAMIMHILENEILKRSNEFESALNRVDTVTDTPGQPNDAIKASAGKAFYDNLRDEAFYRFAEMQAETLEHSKAYNVITSSWTSVAAYIPITFEKFAVAQSLTAAIEQKHPYNLGITVSHTRFWERRNLGKIFLTLSGDANWSNSKKGYGLTRVSLNDYKSLGGTDTVHLAQLKEEDLYLGTYKNYLTPSIGVRLVYLPPDYHFGLSFHLVQNFGKYQALNATIGIPIVLINKKAEPSFNMEFQVNYFDISTRVKTFGNNRKTIGLSVGIPFSKIIY